MRFHFLLVECQWALMMHFDNSDVDACDFTIIVDVFFEKEKEMASRKVSTKRLVFDDCLSNCVSHVPGPNCMLFCYGKVYFLFLASPRHTNYASGILWLYWLLIFSGYFYVIQLCVLVFA